MSEGEKAEKAKWIKEKILSWKQSQRKTQKKIHIYKQTKLVAVAGLK